ncbi:hypothetical protein [Vibrio sp.]
MAYAEMYFTRILAKFDENSLVEAVTCLLTENAVWLHCEQVKALMAAQWD